MKAFAKVFANVFDREPRDMSHRQRIYREWDRQRARALTPSDRAEIDAIFRRVV